MTSLHFGCVFYHKSKERAVVRWYNLRYRSLLSLVFRARDRVESRSWSAMLGADPNLPTRPAAFDQVEQKDIRH